MGDIIKHQKKELSTVSELVEKSEFKGLKIGSILINRDGDYLYKVTKLEVEQRINWDKTREAAKEDGNKENWRDDKYERHDDVLKIYYVEASDWEGTQWKERESWSWVDKFDEYGKEYAILEDGKSPSDYLNEARSVVKGEKNLSDYADTSMNSSGTDLISLGSKEHMEVMGEALLVQQNKAQLVKNFVSRELEMQKRELDKIKRELGLIVEDFKNKVEKINKVIHTIELYLGIKEDIVQIQQGENAPIESPICFRQEVLFMDEEMGDPREEEGGQGIDFRNIEDFDDWLTDREHYKLIIPEDKGVVVLRVRRNKKRYSDNPFINLMMNEKNFKTYIFIRNGDNLYRIWADMNIERLFPRKTELIDLQENAMKEADKYSMSDVWKKERTQKSIKEVEDIYLRYQKQIILLQGLIDRTQIFTPLASPIKLTDPAIHDTDLVRFIYDDETKLGQGKLSWHDFLAKTNEDIGVGSRVFFVKIPSSYEEEARDRFDSRFKSKLNYPKRGLYQVEETLYSWYDWKEKKTLEAKVPCVKYNPNDEVINHWDYWDDGHKRKNRISWRLHMKEDWSWMIDVDNISIEDIDFYLESREDRRYYVHMMPMLWEIRKFLLKEKEDEKDFVQMIAGVLLNEHAKKKGLEEIIDMVWEAVTWWKTKNKWKRALNKDNAKALRMIVNRLKKKV